MTQQNQFDITFWGVRGTMPTPTPANARYGGHTSCVQMRCGDKQLIFDAGSGLAALGQDPTLTDMDIFLSHTHIDHILGFAFFTPAFRANTHIRLWAGHLQPQGLNLRHVMDRIISPPVFPLTFEHFDSDLSFNDFTAGQPINAPHLAQAGIEIATLPLNHPDLATGYRVNFAGKSACYITDIEHLRDGLDAQLVAFIQDSDLLIYDSTYDDRDFERFVGWGHSTWQEAVRLANAANVKQLALFHHDPSLSDEKLDARLAELRILRCGDVVAQEGMCIHL